MNKIYIYLFTGLLTLLLFSCEKYTGNEDIKWQNRKLEPFSSFRLAMDCDVDLLSSFDVKSQLVHKDSMYVVRIRTSDNLFKHIETSVIGGELQIGLKENSIVADSERIKIEVFCPDYRNITILTPGVVTLKMNNTIKKPFLSCQVKNRGSLNLHYVNYEYLHLNTADNGYIMSDNSGTISKAEFENSGNGTIDLFSLRIDSLWATAAGSGNISAKVNSYLNGTILGKGNIYYQGNPGSVIPTITGTGRLIRL